MAAAVAVPLVYIGMNATVAYVVASAIVGAAIGAITSGIMGGDIAQGALYGAIGGAVMGGFTVAMNPGVTSALEAGASTMESSGYAAGVSKYNAVISATESGQAGVLSSGAVSQHDLGMISGGVGPTAKQSIVGGILGESGKSISDGIGTSIFKGGFEGYMKKVASDDAFEAQQKVTDQQRQWDAEQKALDRATAERVAAIRSGGGTGYADAAAINNAGAMARQKEQQKFEREERLAKRQDLKDDRSSFSASVTSASDAFAAKTVKIGSFLNTPSWLQPKANFGMDTSATGNANPTVATNQVATQQQTAPPSIIPALGAASA